MASKRPLVGACPQPATLVGPRTGEPAGGDIALGHEFDDLHVDVGKALPEGRHPIDRVPRRLGRAELLDGRQVTAVDHFVHPTGDGLLHPDCGRRLQAGRINLHGAHT
jgi:hypothetical protein